MRNTMYVIFWVAIIAFLALFNEQAYGVMISLGFEIPEGSWVSIQLAFLFGFIVSKLDTATVMPDAMAHWLAARKNSPVLWLMVGTLLVIVFLMNMASMVGLIAPIVFVAKWVWLAAIVGLLSVVAGSVWLLNTIRR